MEDWKKGCFFVLFFISYYDNFDYVLSFSLFLASFLDWLFSSSLSISARKNERKCQGEGALRFLTMSPLFTRK